MRTSHAAKREAWRQRLARRGENRLSLAEFCRQEGVSVKNFYYWKRRLGERATAPQPAFVPVRVGEASPVHVEIELPNRGVVRVPGDLAREQLTEIIQAVAAAPMQPATRSKGARRC
jgi:transposase-like protein